MVEGNQGLATVGNSSELGHVCPEIQTKGVACLSLRDFKI